MKSLLLKYLLAIILVTTVCFSCNQPSKYHKIGGQTMGTYYAITYQGTNPGNTQIDIEKILLDFNNSVSTYIETSTISQLNQSNNGITLTDDEIYFKPVFNRSQELYELTNGDLDVKIAPLVNYWGFGYKGKDQITRVDSMKVDSLKSLMNKTVVEIIDVDRKDYVSKSIPHAELDFSSLAKGYGIDVIAEYFNFHKVDNFLIDIGGEARANGVNSQGLPWTLAINKPKEDAPANDLEIILQLQNKSLATSGNYRIYYENNGRKYAHIINPKTGYSALTNLLSASIIAEDCMTADGLATAMMVKGLDEAKKFLEKNKYPACLIYDADGDEDLEKYYANGFKDMVMKE